MAVTSGEKRIGELAEIEFNGNVGKQVVAYSKKVRRLARDIAAELDTGAEDARQAMNSLKGHPALMGIDVKLRSRRVARKLKRAKECAQAISAESIKFAIEYRKQFGAEVVRKSGGRTRRKVGL